MVELSVLIPSRNELFLSRTIQDILEHSEAETEVIAVLDGEWAEPPVVQDPRVTVLHYPESIGQRAATNRAAAIARGKYFLKCDAHCSFAQGFDRVLLRDIQPEWTMVPVMRNLHAFDWLCPNGHRRYQSPSGPCQECGAPTERDIVWIAKHNPQSKSYCFDSEPHFQYFGDYTKRPEYRQALERDHITETMSLQGSCFMLSREKYFELDVCGEEFGSWGSQGIEVAVKTWLSGGRVVVNHDTYYAHCFRTSGGDWSFPYHLSGRQVERAKSHARDLFFNNKWEKQVHPLSWLVEKFWPVSGWTDEDLRKLKENDGVSHVSRASRDMVSHASAGIVYYTDNQLDPLILRACQEQLKRAAGDIPIVSVSLQPLDFGRNIVLPLERGYLTMFKQILAGLEALDCDYVYFCEHDVLYHPSHFAFVPPRRDVYYYNEHTWKVDAATGHALHHDCQQTSGLCADRQLLLAHYRQRVANTQAALERNGNCRAYRNWVRAQGFEPGSHHRAERVDDYPALSWQSAMPNLDIRHDANLTPSRWRKDEFRNQKYTAGWAEAEEVAGWYSPGGFQQLLKELAGEKVMV